MPLAKGSHKTLLKGQFPESSEGFPHHLEGKCLTQCDSPVRPMLPCDHDVSGTSGHRSGPRNIQMTQVPSDYLTAAGNIAIWQHSKQIFVSILHEKELILILFSN